MVRLRTVGRILIIVGLAIILLGGFIFIFSLLYSRGLAALLGLATGLMIAVYYGVPIAVIGLIIYFIGRWRESHSER